MDHSTILTNPQRIIRQLAALDGMPVAYCTAANPDFIAFCEQVLHLHQSSEPVGWEGLADAYRAVLSGYLDPVIDDDQMVEPDQPLIQLSLF